MAALRPALLGALVALAACGGRGPARLSRPPNVVLVVTDDQGFGDLGCHGNPQIRTPRVDELARESVELEYFYVCPVCSPTRASLLTGRYNYRTGVVDTFQGRSLMRPDEVTLAEMLRDAGYRTGIFGKWHLGDNCPMRAIDRGFQESLTIRGGGLGQASDPPGGDHYQDPTLYRNAKPVKAKGYVTDLLTDGAIEFIRANRGRPFFAYVPYNAPHTPLEVPEGYLEPYLAAGLPETTARIYAMETNIDDNVGRLLSALDDLGLARDTIFIFMSDNGPQQPRYNANLRDLKGTVFEGGIRVPFFIRWPGHFRSGGKRDFAAAHIDVVPTLLEACGVPVPPVRLDGVSLMPLLESRENDVTGDRTLFFQWHRGDEPELFRACAARTRRWKMVRLKPDAAPMLFDLSDDPSEKNDLAARRPEIVERLSGEYEAWFRDVGSRGYAPPRIKVGTPDENPVFLTRQDCRVAGKSPGRWELEVAGAGTYEIRVLFHGSPSRASVRVAGVLQEVDVPAGAREVKFPALALPAGPARLEPAVSDAGGERGVDYVELNRLN